MAERIQWLDNIRLDGKKMTKTSLGELGGLPAVLVKKGLFDSSSAPFMSAHPNGDLTTVLTLDLSGSDGKQSYTVRCPHSV
jgi:hypothetical protein